MRAPRWLTLLAAQLLGAAVLLVGVGLVAVGVSGAASAGLGAVAGRAFVSADPPGVHYGAARCADLREYAPGARTCAAAATDHHFTEVVAYRGAAGVAGTGLLAGWALVRRHRRRRGLPAPDVLPRAFVPTVGATVFGFAAGALALQSADLAVVDAGRGVGQYLTGAVVAGVIGAYFAVILALQLADGARRASVWQPA